MPGPNNVGRFQYAGYMFVPEVGLYNTGARTYSPTLGRFLQTDPSGYGDGMNWYAYAHGDPVNGTDPTGLMFVSDDIGAQDTYDGGGGAFNPDGGYETPETGNAQADDGDIIVTAPRSSPPPSSPIARPSASTVSSPGLPQPPTAQEVVVTAKKRTTSCLGSALYKNGGSLALDTVGLGASIVGTAVPAYGLAAGGVGLVATTGSLVNSAVHGDLTAIGVGTVGYHVGALGLGADGIAAAARSPIARIGAESIPVLGIAASVLSLTVDAFEVYQDYQACRSGGK